MKDIILRNKLKEHLEKVQKKNSNYSLSAFAKKIQIDRSTLSKIISGKRTIPQNIEDKIIEAISGTEDQKEKLKIILKQSAVSTKRFVHMNSTILSKWYITAVWSLLQSDVEIDSSKKISQILEISLDQVDFALNVLLQNKIIAKDEVFYKVIERSLTTEENIPNESIKNFHKEQLLLATKAIDTLTVNERDFSSLTLPGDPALLKEAQKIIRKMQDDIEQLLASGDKSNVYALNVQFFPLSKNGEKI